MDWKKRLTRLERRVTEAALCPQCKGYGGPMYHVEFENGDPPYEGGHCTLCGGVGCKPMGMKQYLFDSRAMWDLLP